MPDGRALHPGWRRRRRSLVGFGICVVVVVARFGISRPGLLLRLQIGAAHRFGTEGIGLANQARKLRQWIAFGIAVSTLGFLSQGILTAPRVYYAMAQDGLFFEAVGWVSPRTGVPVVAIILQGIAATIIAISGRYEQILNYVVSIDFVSFALTAASIFVFRCRFGSAASPGLYLTPCHPFTTALFVMACAGIVISTIASSPANSAIGYIILFAGIPVYFYWRRSARRQSIEQNS